MKNKIEDLKKEKVKKMEMAVASGGDGSDHRRPKPYPKTHAEMNGKKEPYPKTHAEMNLDQKPKASAKPSIGDNRYSGSFPKSPMHKGELSPGMSFKQLAELEKAKVDEGKSKEVKIKMREKRSESRYVKDVDDLRALNERGVNKPDWSQIGSNGGESNFGNITARRGNIHGKKGKTHGKIEASFVLKEMARINPNLDKSELQPGMSFNDLKKAEAELIEVTQEISDLAKAAKDVLRSIKSELRELETKGQNGHSNKCPKCGKDDSGEICA